jgi:hypothetical protein
MNDQQIALRGREAHQILESAVFKDAIRMIKDAVVQNWRDSPIRDKEGQLLLLQLAKVTDKFEGLIMGAIETGKMAQHRIDLDGLRDESKPRQFFRKVVNG